MKQVHLIGVFLIIGSLVAAAGSDPSTDYLKVTAQGRIVAGSSTLNPVSRDGHLSLQVIPLSGASDNPLNRIELISGDTVLHLWNDVRGNGFLISDFGTLVAIERPDADSVPGRVTVYQRDGQSQQFSYHGIRNPAFSSDQKSLIVTHRDGTAAIDLESFREERFPFCHFAAALDAGTLATLNGTDGIRIDWWEGDAELFSRSIPFIPRDMAFRSSDRTLWLIGAHEMIGIDRSGDVRHSFGSREGEEYVDLYPVEDGMIVGIRKRAAGGSQGIMERRGESGSSAVIQVGAVETVFRSSGTGRDDSIPWPFAPNEQHTVGNSYGAYQGFDPYNPYMHPGIDILVPFGEPVYAVRSGVVKAILTTSGDLHWRVAVSDEDTSGTSPGYLYAHLVEGSIAVNVGDHVTVGQHLGNIVEWVTDFHHLHFARIEAAGTTWSGSWKNTRNPHLLLENRTESAPPIFLDAHNESLFAFCDNQTSNYQNPESLHGEVDVIVSVFDRVLTHYESAVQELWYSIYPVGNPADPVIDHRLAVRFDMELDTYQSGSVSSFLVDLLYKQDTTCQTWFDYDAREFFHILTNSNGDEVYDSADLSESWNTTLIPDGDYVIEVTALDANFNSNVATMTVTTVNGNPPAPTPTPTPAIELGVRIEMPDYIQPGGDFQVRGYLDNPGDPIEPALVFFVLQVHDSFWFWPSWLSCPSQPCQSADWDERTVDTGTTEIIVVPWFVWPDTGTQSVSGLHFFGAMVSPEQNGILGTMAVIDWSYGP